MRRRGRSRVQMLLRMETVRLKPRYGLEFVFGSLYWANPNNEAFMSVIKVTSVRIRYLFVKIFYTVDSSQLGIGLG